MVQEDDEASEIKQKIEEKELKQACVWSLNAFTEDLKNEENLKSIMILPGIVDVVQTAMDDEEKIRGNVLEIQSLLKKENKLKNEKIQLFTQAIEKRFKESEGETISKLNEFALEKEKVSLHPL